MLTAVLVLFALAVGSYYSYKWATKSDKYFKAKNMKSVKMSTSSSNLVRILLRLLSPPELFQELYNKFPNEDIFGTFERDKPVYFIRDPELVKLLAVKNFDHFLDHRSGIDLGNDPLIGKSLIGLRGHQWKEMRSTLSPAFTGNKMRTMFELVSKCGNQTTQYFKNTTHDDIIEVKDFFSRFANDVIATCAFGIEVNSLQNKDNFFYKMGERMTKFAGFNQIIKIILYNYFPSIIKKLNISFFNQKDASYFRTTILETIAIREKENIFRPDMINLLINAKQGKLVTASDEQVESNEFSVVAEHLNSSTKIDWTEDELAAQCFIFFLGGFETVSTVMSFISYELALYPEVQTKLIDEIDSVNNELNGKFLTYEKLQRMKYLDMVVSESLRKWPPSFVSDRLCTNDLDLKFKNRDLEFKVGDGLYIPIYSLHHDPKYFPNPEKFDPERFSEERKHEINPNAYLPFGVGPRNCIASRFALMEVKAAFYYILLNFSFQVCEKTETEFKFGRKNFRMLPDNGIWLRFKSRN